MPLEPTPAGDDSPASAIESGTSPPEAILERLQGEISTLEAELDSLET